jgi:hypothetical protein
MTTSRIRNGLAAAVLSTVALGMAIGSAAPAIAKNAGHFCDSEAAFGGGIMDVREFSRQDIDASFQLVTVEVMAAMPQSDAQLFVDRPGHEAIFRLWGDDEWDDDLLIEFRPEFYWAAAEGLGMRGGVRVSTVHLDGEDSPDADEWYTGIRLTDIRNGSEHKVETCRLTNNFLNV